MFNEKLFNESYDELDHEIVKEIIQLFFEEYPISIEQIIESIQQNDPKRLAQTAHKYKGTVSAMFDEELRMTVYSLEQIGKSGIIENTEHLVISMKQLSLELENELKKLL